MAHFRPLKHIFFVMLFLLAGCTTPTATLQITASPTNLPAPSFTPVPSSTPLAPVTPSAQPTFTPIPTETPTLVPHFLRSVDVMAYANAQDGQWFGSEFIEKLPDVPLNPSITYTIPGSIVANRRNGQISPTLASRYIFLQYSFNDRAPEMIMTAGDTVRALFIRSALMSFVDYKGDRVLDWDGLSRPIPLDLKGVIGFVNQSMGGYPIYLELNYSDYIPGNPGTGLESLQPADNIIRTIDYLQMLEAADLHISGVTFGDEIGDQSGFGDKKPTLNTENMADRFVRYATAIKSAFPEMKVYAFDSDISAASGEMALYDDLFKQIRQAEVDYGLVLLDGFLFRESYVYIDENGKLLNSQSILDDTESLYRPTKVYRYDSLGYSYENQDTDYLHTLLEQTDRIFERPLEIGLSEYLPAGPTQIDESDTSRYADIDFILHYADVMGIYASLGLDFVSTWLGANSVDQAKCYLAQPLQQGVNYPVYQEISSYFNGDLLEVKQDPTKQDDRIKVYASIDGDDTFIMVLNKDVSNPQVIQLVMPGELDLTLKLPAHSYTSIFMTGNIVQISGIGN